MRDRRQDPTQPMQQTLTPAPPDKPYLLRKAATVLARGLQRPAISMCSDLCRFVLLTAEYRE